MLAVAVFVPERPFSALRPLRRDLPRAAAVAAYRSRLRRGLRGIVVRSCGGGEAVEDLVGDDDGYVVLLSQMSQVRAQLAELPAPLRKRLGALSLANAVAIAAIELGAEIGRYAVDDDEANVASCDGDRDLIV